MDQHQNITISIVSHGQFNLIILLLKDLKKYTNLNKIIITINIPEKIYFPRWTKNLPIKIIYNKSKMGFGANHNKAFKYCKTKYFIVLNPDIRLKKDIFNNIIELKENEKINVIGPLIKDTNGQKSVNSRKFPNLLFLINILFLRKQNEYFYKENKKLIFTDWIGGMFMLFSQNDYKILNGFDEDFFLYFEDVDICKRANKLGLIIAQSKEIELTHQAQRKSHHNLIYLYYHLMSYFLFIKKYYLNFTR